VQAAPTVARASVVPEYSEHEDKKHNKQKGLAFVHKSSERTEKDYDAQPGQQHSADDDCGAIGDDV
jgi:hypothetical protein